MFKNDVKHKILLLSLVLLILVGAGSVIAYIHTYSDDVTNKFTPSAVECTVLETFDKTTKSNVRIAVPKDSDDKNVDALIRAKVIITWKNANGETYGKTPVATKTDEPIIEGDYNIAWNYKKDDRTVWKKGSDGFYYYKDVVKPGEETAKLIDSCTPVLGKAPKGYFLSVEIIAEAIQAQGVNADDEKAVEEVWGVDPSTL